jgi:hypothetical protein
VRCTMLTKPQTCSIPTSCYAETRAEPRVLRLQNKCDANRFTRQLSCLNQTLLQHSDPRLGASIS